MRIVGAMGALAVLGGCAAPFTPLTLASLGQGDPAPVSVRSVGSWNAHLRFRVPDVDGPGESLFVDLPDGPTVSRPAIVRRVAGDRWDLRVLSGAATHQYGWKWVGRVGRTPGLVAVLDAVGGSPGWSLLILASPDDGRTWVVRGKLRKPYYPARLEAVVMDAAGRGTLAVRLDDDAGSGTPLGRYRYRTMDAGRTWEKVEGPERPLLRR